MKTPRTTYHRNSRPLKNQETILQFVRNHPGSTALAISTSIGIGIESVRKHTAALELSEHLRHEVVIDSKAREYAFFATDNHDELICFDRRNCIVERTTPAKQAFKKPKWINPLKGLSLEQRLEEIVKRDQMSRLAPQGRMTS